jgi:hypothetical protein
MERAELQSILSDYAMEDDVKRLLYDDDDSLALVSEATVNFAIVNNLLSLFIASRNIRRNLSGKI